MASSTKDNFLDSPYVKFTYKAIVAAFIIGGAWARLEIKMDEVSDRIIKKFDEHIITDSFEKQIIRAEISELKKSLNDIQNDAREYIKSEFIRPDETVVPENRRR